MKITIEEDLCTRIEMLQYEVFSRKEIITSYLKYDDSRTSKLFENYQNEYKQYFIEYNKAKQEMLNKYEVPKDVAWNLNFSTKELIF